MADTGAPYFIPYVEPTDLVREYPAADEAQADAVAAGLTDIQTAIDNIPLSPIAAVVFNDGPNLSIANGATATLTSASITPTATSSNVIISCEFRQFLPGGATSIYQIQLLRGATVILTQTFRQRDVSQERTFTSPIMFRDSPETTSSVTYSLQIGNFTGAGIQAEAGGMLLLEETS